MEDGDHVTLENTPERREVDDQRVDQNESGGPGDLHEREAGEVGALAQELGVDGVRRFVQDLLDDSLEPSRIIDPLGIRGIVDLVRERARGAGVAQGRIDSVARAGVDGKVGRDPGEGSARDVDGVDPLLAKEHGGVVAASTGTADDVDRLVGGQLVGVARNALQRDEPTGGDVRLDILVRLANVDQQRTSRERLSERDDVDCGNPGVHGARP